jgi:hypothetical protein
MSGTRLAQYNRLCMYRLRAAAISHCILYGYTVTVQVIGVSLKGVDLG